MKKVLKSCEMSMNCLGVNNLWPKCEWRDAEILSPPTIVHVSQWPFDRVSLDVKDINMFSNFLEKKKT